MLRKLLTLILLLPAPALFADTPPPETLPPNAKVASLEVRPTTIELNTPFAYSQLVVLAKLESGEVVDATRMATIELPKDVAKISASGTVRPIADGTGQVTIQFASKTAMIPLNVAGMKSAYPASFVKDVQPILSKTGCNAGTCHGSAQGKNGFKLSLRGYDPIFDHRALTDDLEGRRFNRAAPERSLMLLKPTGGVPHAGIVTMQIGDPYYELIHSWIADGVKLDLQVTRVTSVEVFPKNLTVPLPGMKQQFAVIATYADGTKRDVSSEAFIESSNTEVATVDKTGLMTAVRRGETTMLARYEGGYAASTAIIMGDRSGFAWKQLPVQNYIDDLVDAKLKLVKIQPSELCDDADFLRRVHIDLTGLPPTSEAVRKFLLDTRVTKIKRDEVIDSLVGSEAFIEHWTNRWADLLQVNRKFLGDVGAKALQKWIRDAIAKNMPYDQFAYEVLTASGSNVENPPAAYYKTLRSPDAVMENTTQLFLAIRFNCNKCHDHPFEKWTQDQYYQLSAYFAQIDRKEDPKYKGQKIGGTAVEGAVPLVETINDGKTGEIKNERTSQNAIPKFPFTHISVPSTELSRRTQVAKWVTSKDNPYFAKSYANRLWSYMVGVGIIEPVDDIRAGNPATNAELLDRLAKEFTNSNFDVNQLIKTICKSRTYQLSIATNKYNKDDEINASHALPRRLPAEVLFDSIHRVTGSQSHLPGLAVGARAAQLLDSNVDLPGGFLELFGKPVRESACECERSNTMMLGPVLAMVNGPIVAEAISDPLGHLAKFAVANKDDAKVVEEVYLSVLNRFPTEAEKKAGITAIQSAGADFKRIVNDYTTKGEVFKAYQATLDEKQLKWEEGLLAQKPTTWTNLEVTAMTAKSGATLKTYLDDSIHVSGKNADQEAYTITTETDLSGLTGVRLEVLKDDSLPGKGPGRADNGNLVLNEFKATVRSLGKSAEKSKAVKFVTPQASFQQEGFAIGQTIDNNPATGWAIAPQFGRDHIAIFPIQGKLDDGKGVELVFTLDQRFGTNHTIGKFRLSVTNDKQVRLTAPVSAEMVAMVATPLENRTPELKAKLRQMYLDQDKEHQRLQHEASKIPPTDPRVLGAQDLVWALINSPAFLFNH